jgi:hypothetical protein
VVTLSRTLFLTPPHSRHYYKELQVSYYLDSQILGTFYIISQKGIIVGETPEAKHIEKTLFQEYNFSQNFLHQRFLAVNFQKSRSYMIWAMKDRLNDALLLFYDYWQNKYFY